MPNPLLWLTDVHLDYLKTEQQLVEFCAAVNQHKPHAVVITGDISEAPTLLYHLGMMRDLIEVPVYFVLGNHDYYRGSIAVVRDQMKQLFPTTYLPCAGVVELSYNTVLVGHDGWYDGRYADWFNPKVVYMSDDYDTIRELATSPRSCGKPLQQPLWDRLQRLATQGADHLEEVVPKATEGAANIIIATHVPPFPENSVYDGKVSSPMWLPNFSSKIMGNKLLDLAKRYPDKQFLVLCGHSHGKATYQPLPNLVCKTGYAQYKFPEKSIQMIDVI